MKPILLISLLSVLSVSGCTQSSQQTTTTTAEVTTTTLGIIGQEVVIEMTSSSFSKDNLLELPVGLI